jgi:glyoxylase-like metal-dependent hydrolase (beta-lactamase superfamily II)
MSQFHVDRVQVRSTSCPGRTSAHRARTNVWLIGDNRDVVIVDPAGAPELVADAVGHRQVTAVICTHGHRAHIAAAMVLGEGFSAPVLIHPADHATWQAVHGERRYWRLDDGQRIGVAGEEIRVLHTPTTTAGSVTLHIARHAIAFAGDALAHRNLNGEQRHSVAVLDTFAAMSRDTRIHPGHGNSYLLSEMLTDQAHRLDRESA